MLEIITIQSGESRLREKSRELTHSEIATPLIQQLINEMIQTAELVVTAEGWKSAGLAAVQVGKSLRLFVAKNLKEGKFFAYLNPKLELLGEASDIHRESCLSIPGVIGDVERHKRIRLTYTDREGNQRIEKFDGFEARIIQHEYDHLNGILFTDKLKK